MQAEWLQISNQVCSLEVKYSEINITQKYITTKLEHIEKLVQKTQATIDVINIQLAARKIRINTLKASLATMSAIAAALSSLHAKSFLATVREWFS